MSSRRNAEAFAKRASAAIKSEDPALAEYAERIRKIAEADMGKLLASCVARGSAFHHAGLSRQERTIVEEGFRNGLIKCISSTPTLAAGLNLPARRVIIRDYHRFVAGEGMQPIPVSEYHQMAGRAGRPRLDPYGEAVLIAKDLDQVEDLFESYIEAPAEEIHSKIAEPTALYTHILSLIASGFAKNRNELTLFMNRTFYVHENRQGRLIQRAVDAALTFLIDSELVVEVGEHLGSTNFGTLVSKLYIDPRSAAVIVSALRENKIYTDLGLLQVICSTPDMPKLYVRNSDITALSRMIDDYSKDLWLSFPDEDDLAEAYYRALKTAMLLSDWTNEVSDTQICEKYSVGPGDIYGMVESVTWLLHASAELARMFASDFHTNVQEYEICMKNGTRRELLPLIRLRGIGRVRARRLFNNRMTTPDEILAHGIEDVTRVSGRVLQSRFLNRFYGKKERREGLPMTILPFQVRQLSIVLCDPMKKSPGEFEIRQAKMTIGDVAAFLQTIRSIALKHSTHIICFNAENMAGSRHAETAIQYAQRSFFSGKPISNSFEMEALLFAAGSRQCDIAALFGIHEQENKTFVCSYPLNEHIWEDLSDNMNFVTESWDEITLYKEERLKSLFCISDEELAMVGRERILDLILERLALLEVNR